ncbi:HNH endonuclease signature motif containing protein [Arthrobacter sp. Sr33]
MDAVWTAPTVEPPESEAEAAGSTDADDEASDFWGMAFVPGERVRSSDEPPALTGQLGLAAPAGLDSAQVLDALNDVAEARSWLDAQEAKLVTRILDLQTEQTRCGRGAFGFEKTLAAAEIGATLHLPERTAGFLVEHSTLLTRHYPATLNALEDGRLSRRHAWAVVEEATDMPDTDPALAAAYETRLIALAGQTTVTKFCRQAHRLREKLHPEPISSRHRKALREREVVLNPAHDGMAWLAAYLPTEHAAGIFHRVDTAARALQGPDEARTLTQLRADVLVDVLTSAGPTGHMSGPAKGTSGTESSGPEDSVPRSDFEPGRGGNDHDGDDGSNGSNGGSGSSQPREASTYWGVQAKVFVTVPVMTLLGGDTPGELEGYGPIDPETARKLAGHAPSFTRILTHPFTGARLGADATTYRVPQDLKDAVRVRDGTCRHPGCNRLAVFCELDHTTPWSQGGKTSYGNLAALCKRHHMFKTEGYWHYQQPEPGTIIAISPAGETYLTTADPPPAPPADMPPPF